MIEVKKEGIILMKTKLGFENEGVLNPAIIQNDTGIHLFYRAVKKGNFSTIGYCKLSSPTEIEVRNNTPILYSQFEFECQGLEDPRIVKIEEKYYLTYTAFDGVNALGALAVSYDLVNFEKKGVISPKFSYLDFSRLAESKGSINEKYLRFNSHSGIAHRKDKKAYVWDKNVILFPRKIDGKFYMLHRIRPDIQLVAFYTFEDLIPEFWQKYFLQMDGCIIISPKYDHEVSYVGGGCPPIETPQGWLLIYHGVHDTVLGYVYSACAALLELDNPQKVIARLPYPLFKPEFNWELNGEVNNVCFPTGTILIEDTLYIYYGAADEQIACASVSITALISELLLNTTSND
jgi:predicted GH43/DUF377 family glycosyl hydrolase